jgi:hypothetical protein
METATADIGRNLWPTPAELTFLQLQAWHTMFDVGERAWRASLRLAAERLDALGNRLHTDAKAMRALAQCSGPVEALHIQTGWLAASLTDFASIGTNLPPLDAAIVDDITEPLVTAWVQPDGDVG